MYLHWCWSFDFRDFDVSCLGFSFIGVSTLSLLGFSSRKTGLRYFSVFPVQKYCYLCVH